MCCKRTSQLSPEAGVQASAQPSASVSSSPDAGADSELDDSVPRWSRPLGHTSGLNFVAFSPDGSMIASSGGSGELFLWDAATSTPLALLTKQVQAPGLLQWSPQSTHLASVRASELDLLDVRARRVLWSFKAHGGEVLRAVAWSRSGEGLVLATSDGAVEWVEVSTGTVVCAAKHSSRLTPEDVPACSAERKSTPLDPTQGDPLIWSAWSGKTLHKSLLESDKGKAWLSQQGSLAAWVPRDSDRVELRDSETGALRSAIATKQGSIEQVSFANEDRALVVTGFHQKAIVYSLPSGKPQVEITAGLGSVKSASLSAQSGILATASAHDASVSLWDSKTGSLRGRLAASRIDYGVPQSSPTGKRLLAYSTNTGLQVWDLATRKIVQLSEPPENLEEWGWGGDDETIWIVSPQGKLRRAEASTGQSKQSGTLSGWPDFSRASSRPDLVFSPTGTHLAVARDKGLLVWELPSGRLLNLKRGSGEEIFHIAFSPKGDALLLTTWDKAMVLDIPSGNVRFEWAWTPQHKRRALNSSAGDAFLAAAWVGSSSLVGTAWGVWRQGTFLELWDGSNGTKVSSALCKEQLRGMTFSPTGDRVLIDHGVVLNPRTGERIGEAPKTGSAHPGTWGPQGNWYAVAPGDGLLLYAQEGKVTVELHPVSVGTEWHFFALSSSGEFLADEPSRDRVELRWRGKVHRARDLGEFGKSEGLETMLAGRRR